MIGLSPDIYWEFELSDVANLSANVAMRSYIQRIATGPEMSKDLSLDEARDGMRLILDGKVDPVQAAIFLIALRMKRETHEENRGVLQALLEVTDTATAEIDELVDVADPYDGYTRGLPITAFLPCVLAACGVPAVSHGAEAVGPKYGVTQRKVLRAAGKNIDCTSQQVAQRVADAEIGWAYVDQRHFCPKLHELVNLRTLMVKRPCLTTVEVLLGPVRGKSKTHLMTGFVHKAYPPIYTMLARQAGFDSAMIIRGAEGGVIPSLSQVSRYFRYDAQTDDEEVRLAPKSLGIEQAERATPLPGDLPVPQTQADEIATTVDADAAAKAAAETGLAALSGESGTAYDSLVYGAAICLSHIGRCVSLETGAEQARQVLNSGDALQRFNAG